MDGLRIAVALPHLGVYGGIRRFLELGRIWSDRGHDVVLATEDAGAKPWLPFPGRIVPIEHLGSERWDALLSPDPERFLRASAPGALRVFYAVLERAPGAGRAWRSADLVLVNSKGMERHLARRGVRSVLAPGGVNLAMFHPPVPDDRPARTRFSAPVRVLVYGRTSRERKGTRTAVRAIAIAARRAGVPVELVLFDSAPPRDSEAADRRPIPIPHRWVFGPSQEALAALYGDADLFVGAERRAGWCNTAAEAMACGAAVVCTRSGTEDFAVDGETALVARWPWRRTLASKIETLLREPSLRLAIAARGCDRIRAFPWERTATVIEEAIRGRLETVRGRGPAVGSAVR